MQDTVMRENATWSSSCWTKDPSGAASRKSLRGKGPRHHHHCRFALSECWVRDEEISEILEIAEA